MFGASKSANLDGLSIANLLPGIYKGYELKEIKFETAKKQDGSEGKKIITFNFEGPQGPFQHTEWDPETDEKKADNMVKRVEHIMRLFVPKEVIEQNASTTFDQFGQWVLQTLAGKTVGVKTLELKIVGSVYNGAARTGFPLYLGFIERGDRKEYKPLSFSPNELKSNEQYNQFNNAKPDQEADMTSSTGSTGQPLDTDF